MKIRKLLTTTLMALSLVVCLVLSLAGVASATASGEITSALDTTELFTDRDREQTADLADAVEHKVKDGQDIHITEEGVYVLSGSAENVTVYVEAGDEDKVQLVLDGVAIENSDFPCVYVKNADKVFVTTFGDSWLSVTGAFVKDGATNTDGVIFSRDDLVMNGAGTLTVTSTDNGVVCKDDLKITGGTYAVTAAAKCFEANDSIRIADGALTLTAGTDGLHAENDEDDTLGYIYIAGGELTIDAGDDGIHGASIVQIDGGTVTVSAAEGIEGTYIQINDGVITIDSWDDGINGAAKSAAWWPTVEINGGDITITMAAGDTDAVDCNGNLIITGGTVNVTGRSAFDYDGTGQYTGGTLIVNGQQLSSLPSQMGGASGGMARKRWG